MNNETPSAGSGLKLVAYWTVVGVPLAWGICTTILKLQALFAR